MNPLRDLRVSKHNLKRFGSLSSGEMGREALIHCLTGTVTVDTAYSAWHSIGGRRDVFERPPFVVYAGVGEFTVTAESDYADVVIASAPIQGVSYSTLIRPEDVKVHDIGEAHYRRSVREVIGGAGPALRLRMGETINPPGMWSSWPHHSFDLHPELAGQFEEVFIPFFKSVIPGLPSESYLRRRGLLCDGSAVDDMVVLQSGVPVVVPLGFHPICAGLDSHLLYCWYYISPISKQYAMKAEDNGYYA